MGCNCVNEATLARLYWASNVHLDHDEPSSNLAPYQVSKLETSSFVKWAITTTSTFARAEPIKNLKIKLKLSPTHCWVKPKPVMKVNKNYIEDKKKFINQNRSEFMNWKFVYIFFSEKIVILGFCCIFSMIILR